MSCSYNASWAQIGQVTSFFLVFFLLGSRFFPNVAETAAAAAAAAASDTEEYPDYCLKEWTVREKRVLPPLSSEAQALNLRLQQVHALVRHGARAPYDRHCWRWADAADSDLHTGSSRDSSSRDGSSTDGSSFNSSSSSSSTTHRHVGLAPEQDALKSDAERCPPVGHHRQGDCAAAAAAADAAAAAWEVHSDASGTAAAAAAREAPHSSRDSATRDLRAEGSSSSGSSSSGNSSSSEASSPADAARDAAAVAGAAAAAEAPAASTAAPPEELGPPWECAIQEELGMNDSRSDQLSTPLLLKKYVASVTEKGLFRGSCVPSSLLDEGQTQLKLVGSILSQAYVVPAAAAHPKQQQQRLLQQQQQPPQQQQLVHPLFHAQELCAAPGDRVRVRSTDISRTLASGAFLLQSFFSCCGTSPQRVEVETHEVTSDPLLSGYASPVVARLRRQAEASSEFAALAAQQQQAKQQLMEALRLSADELEALWPEVIVDCALTYVCSGRKKLLPPLLQQQDGALLQQLLRFNDQITSFWTSWADAAAAYAAAEPLFHELSTKILAPIRRQQQQQQQPTLSLYMTHDVTLIAVLAALKVYGGIWPPYASVVVFEVYEYLPEQQQQQTQQSSGAAKSAASYVFRLAYNGKVLTGKMPGCVGKALVAPDLCSLEVLLRRMQTRPPMPPMEDEQQQRQVQQQQEQQGPRPQKQQQEAPQQQQGQRQPKEQQEPPQQQLNQQQLQQQKEQQEREQQLRLQEEQQLKRQEEM
ncbi:histidine acid phosphatase domain containing protein, putative [Eimeria necatrix]|uniref:Histidine acid phosphatase domain containing protein, putative n=1 Tax=Eimeria necatrix TaxID=51315 RepID=U6MLV2_9EIME|nr:histidine acid phosphatase domain containing protein, putative [Eimeria necatrix]CDJ65217.1 histidine acid phosphatase domain containing protein, putative [Eimeria necatrix]